MPGFETTRSRARRCFMVVDSRAFRGSERMETARISYPFAEPDSLHGVNARALGR
jgi:hypothetical protein